MTAGCKPRNARAGVVMCAVIGSFVEQSPGACNSDYRALRACRAQLRVRAHLSPNQVLTHAARAAALQSTSGTSGGRARRARRALVRATRTWLGELASSLNQVRAKGFVG